MIKQSDMKRTFGARAKKAGDRLWVVDSESGEFHILVKFNDDGSVFTQAIVASTESDKWSEASSTDDIAA